jgi:hypothetical protein
LDDLPKPSQVGQTRIGGIDINQPRIRSVLQSVIWAYLSLRNVSNA